MAAVYGGELVGIEGTYDDVNRFCSRADRRPESGEGWGFVNVNLRPYYAEGSKTLAYEIAEQLGWRLPEQIVIPIASGSQLTKIDKGLRELIALGPGRGPAVPDLRRPGRRLLAGRRPRSRPATTWSGRCGRTPSPSRWPSATRPTAPTCSTSPGAPAARSRTSPTTRSSTAIRLLARTEGIFAETAGGVTVGVLRKLVETGQLDPAAETVVINTGDGLKTLDAVSPTTGLTAVIRPTLDSFREAGLA